MLLASCAFLLPPVSFARADQIVVKKTTYLGAKVVGYDGGMIAFRTAEGGLQQAWLSDVGLIIVDRGGVFADFNEAEQYLHDGEAEKAVLRYRRTLRLCEDFWADLVESRLLVACDRAGDLRQATLNFVRVVRGKWSGPSAAARLMPQAIPETRDATVQRAIEQLENAMSSSMGEEHGAPLKLFRYEILRHVSDPRAGSAARAVAVMDVPKPLRCERVYDIQLAALESVLGDHAGDSVGEAALASVDRAIRYCPKEALPSFLLLKGKTLLDTASTKDEIIRAAWAFMRVAIHEPNDPRAAEGLLRAAGAVERIGREDQAAALLEECLQHRYATDDMRRRAEAALARLRSDDAGSQ